MRLHNDVTVGCQESIKNSSFLRGVPLRFPWILPSSGLLGRVGWLSLTNLRCKITQNTEEFNRCIFHNWIILK
jgi:hypothetical protein